MRLAQWDNMNVRFYFINHFTIIDKYRIVPVFGSFLQLCIGLNVQCYLNQHDAAFESVSSRIGLYLGDQSKYTAGLKQGQHIKKVI